MSSFAILLAAMIANGCIVQQERAVDLKYITLSKELLDLWDELEREKPLNQVSRNEDFIKEEPFEAVLLSEELLDLWDELNRGNPLNQTSRNEDFIEKAIPECEIQPCCCQCEIQPCCCQRGNLSLWGSFLYWKPYQDNCDIALASPYAIFNDLCGVSFTDGGIKELQAHFSPGFNIGASYQFCLSDWSVWADYQDINVKASKSLQANPNGILYARLIQPNLISNNSASFLSINWNLDLQLADFCFEKNISLGDYFSLSPFLGVASAWLDQDIKEDIFLISPKSAHLKNKISSHSFGIGPQCGLEGQWEFFCPFALVASLTSKLLFTEYKLKLHQMAADDPTVFLTMSNKIHGLRPVLEMYLGVTYGTECLNVEIGYDFQVWWNQNMLRWYNDLTYIATPQGNLYWQGLVVTLQSSF